MEKIGNSIKLNYIEKKVLKRMLDRKYGKVTTSIDFESSGRLHDIGVEADIFTRIGEMISGSTIERIVGLTKYQGNTRSTSLEILSKYLDFTSIDQLLSVVEKYSCNHLSNTANFDIYTFMKNHLLKINLENNKEIIIRYLESNKFEVLFSKKSKLTKGDCIEIIQLVLNEELICGNVYRTTGNKNNNMGQYKSGENNKVKSICFVN